VLIHAIQMYSNYIYVLIHAIQMYSNYIYVC